jgi:uncharacterized tellurite resistance protein B-like protein
MIALEQLKILVNLSLADGEMSEKEKQYIKNIGKAHGFPESSVETLFYGVHDIILPDDLTPDQKFDYAWSLVELMLVDEIAYQPEIQFCSEMLQKLGYQKEAAGLLMKAAKEEAADKAKVKLQMATYLKIV